MSEKYCNELGDKYIPTPTTTPEMRIFCQRPGKKNEDGSPCYFTEQAHKDICDINKIIARFDKQGVLTHVNKFEAQFGDMTGGDYKSMSDQVINAKYMFDQLPSIIRNEFDNDPGKLLEFMENPENRDRAIEIGLIDSNTPANLDGIGEHIKEPNKEPDKEPEKTD